MRSIRWSSTAQRAYADDPVPGPPIDLEALYHGWLAAPNKGDYVCGLPLDQAAQLVAVLKDRAVAAAAGGVAMTTTTP